MVYSSAKRLLKKYAISKEELQSQVDEIFGDVDLDRLLYEGVFESLNRNDLECDDIVEGKVVLLRHDYVLIDFGYKSEGFLPYSEDDFNNDDLDINDKINCIISKIDDRGNVFLTRKNVDLIIQQQQVLDSLEVGKTVVGKLIEQTKSGWVVSIDGFPATLPTQKEFLLYLPEGASNLLDTEIEAVVDSIDDVYVTLTRESYAEDIKKKAKNNFFTSLNVGDLVEGTIKNIADFGIFIQIASGIIGLCHTSDKGSEELKLGKKVMSKVLKIDRDKSRVSLGIRQVTEPSWDEIVSSYNVDDKITATVKKLVPYGAFMEVEPGVSGLIHVSDLSWSDHIKHPKEVLSEGEEVEVIILGIDIEKQHLSLGLKQITDDPWEFINEKYLVGSSVIGKVTNKTKFGIFVELEKGVEGLAHHTVESKSFKTGDEVEVTILRIDILRKKISLGFD